MHVPFHVIWALKYWTRTYEQQTLKRISNWSISQFDQLSSPRSVCQYHPNLVPGWNLFYDQPTDRPKNHTFAHLWFFLNFIIWIYSLSLSCLLGIRFMRSFIASTFNFKSLQNVFLSHFIKDVLNIPEKILALVSTNTRDKQTGSGWRKAVSVVQLDIHTRTVHHARFDPIYGMLGSKCTFSQFYWWIYTQ